MECEDVEYVFVSWGSPDAPIARPLIQRLRDVGLCVKQYETSMTAGDHISKVVSSQIEQALIVVVLMSPQTKDRPWVQHELGVALAAYHRGEVLRVIPVRLDGLPAEDLPPPVQMAGLSSFGFTKEADEQEEALARLIHEICVGLGIKAPLVVPTRLLAMTRTEFGKIFPPGGGSNDLLESICSKVGMHPHPKLREELEQRYGDHPEDFAPFGPQPLIDHVRAAQRTANSKRIRGGDPPVHLRWLPPSAFDNNDLRDLWGRHHSFLIVDSVSTFSQAVVDQIQDLPHMEVGRNLAVMWVPPYTRHTMELESLIQASLKPKFLADNFGRWRREDFDHPYLTFDVATTTTLHRWVAQAIESFNWDEKPDPAKLKSFAGPSPRRSVRPWAPFQSPEAGEVP